MHSPDDTDQDTTSSLHALTWHYTSTPWYYGPAAILQHNLNKTEQHKTAACNHMSTHEPITIKFYLYFFLDSQTNKSLIQ